MKYLTIYLDTTPIICIDLKKPNIELIRDALYYTDKYQLDGYISNYKNLYKADFKRTADSADPVTSRQIAFWDVPKQLNNEELIELLGSLKVRSDKSKRQMNPKSLQNLKPAGQFTADDHPIKPRLLTEEQLDKAEELRRGGCSWRQVGDLLRCNCQTVRSSLRRRMQTRLEEKAKSIE